MKRLALLFVLALPVAAQEIRFDQDTHVKPQHVELLDDAVTVQAGKPQDVDLRFRVLPGLHINSHKPKDETLLSTVLELTPPAGGTVLKESYPPGAPFRLNIGAGETLDVYQGEFRVSVRLTAPRGESLLTGALHYQACDTASCFPPRTLPVKIAVTAK